MIIKYMKKLNQILILFFLLISNGFSQGNNFIDSLSKTIDPKNHIKDLNTEVFPCISWYNKKNLSIFYGRFTYLLTEDGENIFKDFFERNGYNGFYDGECKFVCESLPADSVLNYYHNNIKPLKYDEVSYSIKINTWGKDTITSELLGYSESRKETYHFYNRGKSVMKIYILWEDNFFRGWWTSIIVK
jgi:hypothetical protein